MWLKILTMLRLRENENNVCIFFMEKKLTSYLVPIIFFACPPIFLLPKLGMDWNMNSLTFLYFYASYNYSVKPILRENCLKWAIFHMKKKLSLYLSQNFFLPAHPSFFLLTSVLITCHRRYCTYFQISDKRYFGEYFAAKNILVLFRRVNTEKISKNVNALYSRYNASTFW